jgi:hypothetical protein
VSIYPPSRITASERGPVPSREQAFVAAVLDDMRHTLRMGWVDLAIRSVASQPVFFTAAWAATRPNVTRSFAAGAEQIRAVSLHAVRDGLVATDEWTSIDPAGASVDLDRVRRTIQAIHYTGPRVLLIVQAWAILARRQRLPGTGLEEPPAKRGVPAWQEGILSLPRSFPSESEALLDEATVALNVAFTPPALQATALSPHRLERVWRELGRAARDPAWTQAIMSIRRLAATVLRSLPHPMELQWDVLPRRGLTEDKRQALADHLVAMAASIPVSVLVASALAEAYDVADVPGEW